MNTLITLQLVNPLFEQLYQKNHWFQPFKCEYLLLFLAFYDGLLIGQNKQVEQVHSGSDNPLIKKLMISSSPLANK